ncbi:MAG: DNA replication/repair protein RecF [Bacteroidota bacterium]
MKTSTIDIQNFRNHSKTVLACAEGVNAIIGDNGQGKTNIVEAISYLCLTKSFYASGDAVTLKIGEELFSIRGSFESDGGVVRRVEALYEKGTGRKSISINGIPVETMSSVIGEFPVVVLSPEQGGITNGAPSERRKFLDLVIAQSSKAYLQELLEYRKILRQRNKVLLDAKFERRDCTEILEPWDEALVETGSHLVHRRQAFIREFSEEIVRSYKSIAGESERPGIDYEPSVPTGNTGSVEAIKTAFTEELRSKEDEERRLGVTAVGPHRDEIGLSINGIHARRFASQGQHKTLLIALKLAEVAYLKERCSETPILLLDDVFSELDEHRSERLVEQLQGLGQVFVTATDLRAFPAEFPWRGKNQTFTISAGAIAGTVRRKGRYAAAGAGN